MINGNGLPLAVVGCDFRVASSHWRSLLVFDEEESKRFVSELKRIQAADGFVDLNTCNRNEWIVSSADPQWAAELMKSQMVHRAGSAARDWIRPYAYTGDEAARHVFRVAIGQESLVVGERQIASQLYRALEVARERGTSSRILNGLGSIAGRLVRIALRRGCIESAAVGVHSLALNYLRQRLGEQSRAPVAIVGLGRIGRRVLGVMTEALQMQPVCLNRTVRENQEGRVRPLTDLPRVLGEVEAAIVCTGGMKPVISAGQLGSRPADHPLLLVDIGIPSQVDPTGLPSGVEVVGLDELTDYHQRSCREDKVQNVEEAEQLVQRAVVEFRAFCNAQAFSGILDTVQRHHRQLVSEEIPRLVAGRFGYLPEEARTRLEGDLKNIVLEYTTEVFRTIKETTARDGQEETCRDES
jgi:glutamyl-tRNA reductase